jgi:hypothetical protein
VTALGAIPWTGCASSVVHDQAALDEIEEVSPARHSKSTPGPSSSDKNSVQSGVESTAAKAPPDQADAELIELLAELRRTGAIDQSVQQNLIKDWQASDPSVRPQLLEMFRTTLSYRRENAATKTTHERSDSKPSTFKQPVELSAKAELDSSIGVRQTAPRLQNHDAHLDHSADKPAVLGIRQPDSAVGEVARVKAMHASPSAADETIFQTESGSPSPTLVEVNSANEVLPAAVHGGQPGTQTPGGKPSATLPSPNVSRISSDAVSAEPSLPSDTPWQEHLDLAIAGLESELPESPSSAGDVARHAGLRLLYLLDGRRSDALRPIDGLPPSQQDFWSEQLYGLAAYMDSERNQDSARRSAEASHHFREALARLNSLATLEVKNLAFCTDVKSFGVYEPFTKNVFKPGQEILIYAEVENFSSVPAEKGHKISLRTSYQILDPHEARVAKQEFPVVASECRAVRRDLFVSYSVFLPQRIYPGKYILQLSVEDLQSQKLGSAPIEFEIEEK